ncbi:hypothetical protein BU16DRAFT_567371 [Lophium mytilinum]|uniref:Uncharacterized protein n=1 Tax=Lophium mytilinum TaxID=390894 RepID=A0A6A6QAC5_9PEZI|nr:hypothetical protein BU16DRAFT_567371 [Lophium mytilinum]
MSRKCEVSFSSASKFFQLFCDVRKILPFSRTMPVYGFSLPSQCPICHPRRASACRCEDKPALKRVLRAVRVVHAIGLTVLEGVNCEDILRVNFKTENNGDRFLERHLRPGSSPVIGFDIYPLPAQLQETKNSFLKRAVLSTSQCDFLVAVLGEALAALLGQDVDESAEVLVNAKSIYRPRLVQGHVVKEQGVTSHNALAFWLKIEDIPVIFDPSSAQFGNNKPVYVLPRMGEGASDHFTAVLGIRALGTTLRDVAKNDPQYAEWAAAIECLVHSAVFTGPSNFSPRWPDYVSQLDLPEDEFEARLAAALLDLSTRAVPAFLGQWRSTH